MKHSLTILIPSFNEEINLRLFMPKILEYAIENQWLVFLIDDGSTDNSKDVYNNINSEQFIVISYKNNKGVGGALKKGISKVQTDYCVTFDADGQHNLDDVDRLLKEIKTNDYDMVIGERENSNVSGLYRSFGKMIIKLFASLVANKKIKDLNTGLRIFKTSTILNYLECLPDSFSFHDLSSILFILKKHEIGTIPVKVENRKYGKSIISAKHALITVNDIINLIVLFHPLRIFLPTALVLFFLGCVWSLPYLLAGKGLSVGGLFLLLMGIFSFFFGIISEQLSQIRKHQLKLYD